MNSTSWRKETIYLLWTVFATLWIALSVILPDFLDNPITGLKGITTIFVYVTAVSVVSFLVFYIIGISKYVAPFVYRYMVSLALRYPIIE